MKKSILIYSLLLFLHCRNDNSNSIHDGQSMVESSIGLIHFKGDIKDAIDYYDENSKKRGNFFLYDLINIKNVTPYAYNAEYRLMAFKIIPSELPDMTKVLSSNSKDVMYLKKGEDHFVSKSWEEHVMSVFAVRATTENRFHIKASAYSTVVALTNEQVAMPLKINREWLMVEYEKENTTHSAWIRWKKNGKIVIDLVYVS